MTAPKAAHAKAIDKTRGYLNAAVEGCRHALFWIPEDEGPAREQIAKMMGQLGMIREALRDQGEG